MSAPTQEEVKSYIKSDRTLTSGKNLYRRFPNRNRAVEMRFNRIAGNERNIKQVCYELCVIAGIPERMYNVLINQPIKKGAVTPTATSAGKQAGATREELILTLDPAKSLSDQKAAVGKLLPKTDKIKVPKFSKGVKGTNERKAFLKDNKWEHNATKNKELDAEITKLMNEAGNETLAFESLLKEREELVKQITVTMPVAVKQKLKLNEQFPFLRDKNCPDEYKVLVADMITAYHAYKDAHPKLTEALNDEDRKAIAKTVKDNFLENKQIWAELEHFQKNGEPLGEHPVFKEGALKKDYSAMDAEALGKKIKSLENNIRRNSEKAKDKKRTAQQRDASASLVEDQKIQLDLAKGEYQTR